MTTELDPDATRAQLRAFAHHHDYDTSYLEQLLDDNRTAFGNFAAAQAMSQHRDRLTADAHAIACTTVMLQEDCGACAQLNLRMAVEAGVRRELLATLLEHPEALPAPLDDVYRHARQVCANDPPDLERVARLRDALGADGFAELAVSIVGARIYPTLKRALGTATACRRPTLDF